MSEKRTFILCPSPHPSRSLALEAVRTAPDGMAVVIQEQNRSLAQNAAMWPLLAEWAKQVEWPVNGKAQRLTPEDWKNILTAAFRRETGRIAQGLDGGMVLLGARTREFGKKEFSDFLEFIHAAAAERGVALKPATESEPLGRTA